MFVEPIGGHAYHAARTANVQWIYASPFLDTFFWTADLPKMSAQELIV